MVPYHLSSSLFFLFKQKTAYEIKACDWSSDVCSSDLPTLDPAAPVLHITGNPLIVPCPGKGSNGFVLSNVGGQTLDWQAKVNRAGGSSDPVTLSTTSGSLYGSPSSGTNTVTVTVRAKRSEA